MPRTRRPRVSLAQPADPMMEGVPSQQYDLGRLEEDMDHNDDGVVEDDDGGPIVVVEQGFRTDSSVGFPEWVAQESIDSMS